MRSSKKTKIFSPSRVKNYLRSIRENSLKKKRHITTLSADHTDNKNQSNPIYIKRYDVADNNNEKKTSNNSVESSRKVFEDIFTDLSKYINKDNEHKLQPLFDKIVLLQTSYANAIKELTIEANKKFAKDRDELQEMLLNKSTDQNIYSKISKNIMKLNQPDIYLTSLDDERVKIVKKVVKKESGANAGYTITNDENTKFTVKQGKTIGNTLSEVFSSMVLTKMAEASNVNNNSNKIIAHAFLVVDKTETTDKDMSIEQNCKKHLFAASEWSTGKSFEACQLFGLEKRKKAAGSRLSEDFEDLRELNKACGLGLDNIVVSTSLIADFDLHTENFMLKINLDNLSVEHKKQAEKMIDLLFKESLKKSDSMSRETRLNNLINIIKSLQKTGAQVYFHKIDHDSGFYRYVDPKRTVDLTSHHTSPLHRQGLLFKTQPTSHVSEITGSTKGIEELLLTDQSIDGLLKINLNNELKIIQESSDEFFDVVRSKASVLARNDNEKLATEYYLLNEFYCHLTEKSFNPPKSLTNDNIIELRKHITAQLKAGTAQKVKDLHIQLFNALEEKNSKGEKLTDKQSKLMETLKEEEYIQSLMRGKLAKGFS